MTTDTSLVTLPSMVLAPTRKRAYSARNPLSQARAERVHHIIDELPVTPTIRQVYYILVGDHLILKTDAGYKSLVRQLGAMRKGGELSYTALIDGTRDRKLGRTFTAPSEALAYARELYRRDPWATQVVVPEVWAEADTLSQMLWQVADPLRVPVVVCRGNSSLSQLYTSAAVIHKRWEDKRQQTAIIYVGDFDPAGMDMSEGLHGRLVEVGAPGHAFTVDRVAITPAQIATYNLPPHTPKKTDGRTPQFVARYGTGCVEADALPPAVLAAVVNNAIMRCITDRETWDEAWEQQDLDQGVLTRVCEEQGVALDLLAARDGGQASLATMVDKALRATLTRAGGKSGMLRRAEIAHASRDIHVLLRTFHQCDEQLAALDAAPAACAQTYDTAEEIPF